MLLSLLLVSLLPAALQGAPPVEGTGPPGTQLIGGGTTTIGFPLEGLTRLLEDSQSARQKAQRLLAEHPRHEREVASTFMMVSEVTNEQYLEFVRATGGQPPLRWGRPAIDAACARFVETKGAERERARAAGDEVPARQAFDEDFWWHRNWHDAEWEMPREVASKPVVRITHREATQYASWAGMRLPTEFEFERAVRGDGTDEYPWGAEWAKDHAATLEMEKTEELPDVGSFPAGANPQGIVDLIGSVWEWTSSPFLPYPEWTSTVISIEGKGLQHRIDDMPRWEEDHRVTRGGSQSTDALLARASSRQGSERGRRASTLGFRCVASTDARLERSAEQVRAIPQDVLPQGAGVPQSYSAPNALLLHRWRSVQGTAKVPGYRVITGHDAILFTPVTETYSNGLSDLRKRTRPTELLHIGVFSSDLDLIQPPLPAGVYLVALRGAGSMLRRRQEDKAREQGLLPPPVAKQLDLDRTVDNLVFLDRSGTPVAGIPTDNLSYGSPDPGRLGWRSSARVAEPKAPAHWDLTYFVPGRSRSGLLGGFAVQFSDPFPDQDWVSEGPPE